MTDSNDNNLLTCAQKYRTSSHFFDEVERQNVMQCLQASNWRDVIAAAKDKSDLARTFIHANSRNHIDIVEAFLDNGINADIKDIDGRTALITAIFYGYEECVRLLLDHHADVDVHDEVGLTALISASKWGRVAIAELLLEKCANVNFQNNNGRTCLMEASQNGHKEVVQLLLNHGADIDLKNKAGKTALDFARTEEIKELLRNHVCSDYVLK